MLESEHPESAAPNRERFANTPYGRAALGFRNHWYPALYSGELEEGGVQSLTMLGEPIFLTRVDGVVHAVRDRCLHRGVPFSRMPESYCPGTLTCWYHGFTYDISTGRLVTILTEPESALIGKLSLRTYPVAEQKGVVFLFIGDLRPVPPLADDVQPDFLDPDVAISRQGITEVVQSNWRLAAENGFDAAHIYIHRNSALLERYQKPLPLGTVLDSREGMVVAPETGPKGVAKTNRNRRSVWSAEVEGHPVTARFLPEGPSSGSGTDTSIWLPCGLRVEPFPVPDVIQYEWYVPIDETSHRYFITWGTRVHDEGGAAAFEQAVSEEWGALVTDHFNNQDVIAREAMEPFYRDEDGWTREHLFGPDVIITAWRRLANQYHRGVQMRADVLTE